MLGVTLGEVMCDAGVSVVLGVTLGEVMCDAGVSVGVRCDMGRGDSVVMQVCLLW